MFKGQIVCKVEGLKRLFDFFSTRETILVEKSCSIREILIYMILLIRDYLLVQFEEISFLKVGYSKI